MFEVAIDIDGDNDFDDPNEDISAYVLSKANITASRGKGQIRLYSPPEAGRFNALIDNVTRNFSPGYVSSFVYGKRLPGRKVRWLTSGGAGGELELEGGGDLLLEGGGSLLLGGTPKRTIFTGRLDRFIHHADYDNRTVEMPTLGMLSRLVGKNISTQVYQNITTSDAIEVILDLAGWPAGERILQTGLTVFDWWWWTGDAFQGLIDLFLSEGPGAALYENPDGWLVFENRDARNTQTRSTVSQVTYAAGTDLRIQPPFEYNENEQDVIEACAVQIEEREAQPESEIWSLGETLTLAPNEVWQRRFVTADPFINAQLPDSVPGNTIFTLTGSHPLTSGTFKLEYLGVQTSALAYTLTNTAAETALETLYGAGNVSCTGGPLNSAPIFCELIGDYASLNITTLPTVISSTLNPVSIDGAITVEEIAAGGSPFYERQRLIPSGILTAGTFTIGVTWSTGSGTTSSLNYNATASQIATAVANISGLSLTTAYHGPINTTPVELNLVNLTENIDNVVITGTGLMMQTPGATVDIAVSQAGGIADYIVTAGSLLSIQMGALSGTSTIIIVTAGGSGVTLTGLRVRGQFISVARSDEVLYPEDADERIANGEDIKVYRPGVLSGVSRATAEIIAMLYVLFYSEPRPTINLTIENDWLQGNFDNELVREISDRVTVQLYQLGIDEDYFIDHIEHSLVGAKLITRLGLEKAMAA